MNITSSTFINDRNTLAPTSADEVLIRAEDNDIFAKLFAATLGIYGLEVSECLCSKGHIKRWNDLADLWGSCAADRDEPNILMIAIHRIHWGIYPKNLPKKIPVEVIDDVMALLKKEGNAHRGWKHNRYYRDAFAEVIEQRRPVGKHAPKERLGWFLRHIRNCSWLQIVYHGAEPPSIDLSHYSRGEFMAAKKHAIIFNEVYGYETVIKKLVPEASSWDEIQWRDERLLYKRLRELYNLEMNNYNYEFDKLIDFLMELWHYNTTSIACLLCIKDVPEKLMAAIWPVSTKYEVTKLFCLAYGRVKSVDSCWGKYGVTGYYCNWNSFQNSWIYQRCKEWAYNKELEGAAPRTASIIFNIDMGIVT